MMGEGKGDGTHFLPELNLTFQNNYVKFTNKDALVVVLKIYLFFRKTDKFQL